MSRGVQTHVQRERLNAKDSALTPELNTAAEELCEELRQIQNRIIFRENPLFPQIDRLLNEVDEAIGCLKDFFRHCQTTNFKDEITKQDIEDIIPKLLKHAKMVARNIPEPRIRNEPRLSSTNALKCLYKKVGEAERDPAKWEDVKKTLLEAITP